MKVGIVDSGVYQQLAYKRIGFLTEINYEFLPVCKLSRENIYKYDAIIIPSRTNQDVLLECKTKIEKFVKNGGLLIILGASTEQKLWLPLKLIWNGGWSYTPKFSQPSDADTQIIFKNLQLKNLILHKESNFCSHGSIKNVPEDVKILLEDENGNTLMLIFKGRKIKGKTKGSILLTTLDPDLHVMPEHTGKIREPLDWAKILLNNIIEWAKTEDEILSKMRKKYPYYSNMFFNSFNYLIVLIISIFVFTAIGLSNTENAYIIFVLASIISIMAFIMALYDRLNK